MVKWQLSYPTQDVPTLLNITCLNRSDIKDHIIFTISDIILTTQEIIIDGFTASTKYTCCISVTSEIGTSQDVCQNVTLFNNVEQGKLTLSIMWNICTFPCTKYQSCDDLHRHYIKKPVVVTSTHET